MSQAPIYKYSSAVTHQPFLLLYSIVANLITLLTTENSKYKMKNTEQQSVRERGKNKALTLQLGGANCSFNDKVLDDKCDEDGDDGENHEEEERALLVCQAPSGSVGLRAGLGP